MPVVQQKPKRTEVSREEILSLIPRSRGLLEPLERALHCTRGALREALRRYPELQIELNDEMERVKDRIILVMMEEAMGSGGRSCDRSRDMLLKALARDRGFGDKMEISGASCTPLVALNLGNNPAPKGIEGWASNASEYGRNQERLLDSKMKELGLDNSPKN